MSKVLVIHYSHTGTSRQLAQRLCRMQDWPGAEITEAHAGRGNWRCVLDSLLRRKPEIRYGGPPVNVFDLVVLVAPIWAYRLAGPMRSFVALYRDQLPAVAVISTMGGSGAPNAVAEIAHMLGHAPLMSTAFTQREVADGSCAGRLQAFATAIQSAADQQEVLRPSAWAPQAA